MYICKRISIEKKIQNALGQNNTLITHWFVGERVISVHMVNGIHDDNGASAALVIEVVISLMSLGVLRRGDHTAWAYSM